MNTIKKVFARFLIVCWLGVVAIMVYAVTTGFNSSVIASGALFGIFILIVQFIFYGFLHPLKLIQVGVVEN